MRAFVSVMTLAAFLSFAPVSSWAGSVDPGQVTSFENGQPADADEMNSTLQALISAIDDNAARIAALEAAQPVQDTSIADLVDTTQSLDGRVGALESNAPPPTSVVGSWKVFGLEVEASGRDDALAGWSGGWVLQNDLTLNTNGTFSIVENDFGSRMMITAFQSPCDWDIPEGAQCVGTLYVNDLAESDSGTDSGTWTHSGQSLTLTYSEGDVETLTLEAGGSMFVGTGQELDDIPDGGSIQRSRLMGLSIGVKVGTGE